MEDKQNNLMSVSGFVQDAFASAKVKFLNETFSYLNRIHTTQAYQVKSSYAQINGVELSLSRGERCFNYTTKVNIIQDKMLVNRDAYGLSKGFTLVGQKETIEVPHISTASFNFGDTFTVSGEIHEIQIAFLSELPKYFRLLLPKENSLDKNHKAYIESERFVINDTIHLHGLSEFRCANALYQVFDYEHNGKSYLVIDSMNPVKYIDFETAIASIVYTIGFITGYVPRNETQILQAADKDFRIITGLKYRRIEDTISTSMEVVSPLLLSEAQKSNIMTGHVTLSTISNMASKAYEDRRFLRALKITCEGNTYPLEIRASSYSVALETIKNIIIEEHADKVNPFKEKADARLTIRTLISEVNKISDAKFNNKEAVIKKLEQLNQVTNRDSFKTAYKMCNIQLTPADEQALLLRNDFLHGRLPFEDEPEFKHKQELKYTTYKLHFLLALLVMKYSGFTGYIINSPKLLSLLNPDGKEIKEPAFWKI